MQKSGDHNKNVPLIAIVWFLGGDAHANLLAANLSLPPTIKRSRLHVAWRASRCSGCATSSGQKCVCSRMFGCRLTATNCRHFWACRQSVRTLDNCALEVFVVLNEFCRRCNSRFNATLVLQCVQTFGSLATALFRAIDIVAHFFICAAYPPSCLIDRSPSTSALHVAFCACITLIGSVGRPLARFVPIAALQPERRRRLSIVTAVVRRRRALSSSLLPSTRQGRRAQAALQHAALVQRSALSFLVFPCAATIFERTAGSNFCIRSSKYNEAACRRVSLSVCNFRLVNSHQNVKTAALNVYAAKFCTSNTCHRPRRNATRVNECRRAREKMPPARFSQIFGAFSPACTLRLLLDNAPTTLVAERAHAQLSRSSLRSPRSKKKLLSMRRVSRARARAPIIVASASHVR